MLFSAIKGLLMEEIQEKKKFSFKEAYNKRYKALLVIPMILFVLALVQVGYQTATTGDFFHKGVSLKGGLTVSIEKSIDINNFQELLNNQFPKADISVRSISKAGTQVGTLVEASDVDADELTKLIESKAGITKDDYSVEVIGGSLGASFFKETFRALILAFLFMAIVVYIYFRVPIPSLAVILCAACDIIETVALANILEMKISTAGIAAFLMLIGYSVDTDILLTARVLKRQEGDVTDSIISAMKTGVVMTLTALVAATVALIFSQSEVITQIMTILIIGLLFDLINTWIQNAAILKWYCERKKRANQNV